MFPGIKVVLAVTGAIVSAEVLGNKLGGKLVGPEQSPGDATMNIVKEYAAIIGVGLTTYIALHMLLKL